LQESVEIWRKACKMKPKKSDVQKRIFEPQLDQIINMEHPLVLLAGRIDWASIDSVVTRYYL